MADKKSTPPLGTNKKTEKKIADIEKQLKSIQAIKPPDLSETVDQSQSYLKTLKAIKAGHAEINDLAKAQVDLEYEIMSAMQDAQKAGKKILDTDQEEFDLQHKILKLQQTQAKTLLTELKNKKVIHGLNEQFSKELKIREKSTKKLAELENKYKDSVEEGLGFIDDITDKIKDIPIVGNFLSKALGLDKVKEELTNKFTGYITKALDPASAKQKEASDAALKGYDAQIDKLNLVKDEAGNITGVMEEIPEAAAEASTGISSIENATGGVTKGIGGIASKALDIGKSLFSAIPGAFGLSAALGPMLLIVAPLVAAAVLFKKALDVDKEVTEMARGLGISKHEAEGVHHELLDIATNTKVVGANAEALGESYMELAKSMGVTQLANKEMAETQVYLKKQIGLSSEEASAFQKMSMAGGKSAEQNLAVIQASVEGMTGGLMNYKEVAKDIATSSKAVQASYKGNIAALTKAVITAKKFGMTLDKAKAAASGVLDVESSLEAEMKANVLTGKNMNLNEARRLELAGDHAGAMEEMMKQAGDFNELQGMEEYQRKAIADAMNMSVEDMMAAAEHQKNMNDMAKDLGITLDENGRMSEEQIAIAMNSSNEEAKKLAIQQQQNDAQEKMGVFTDKLSAAFTKLAGPIMELIDPMLAMLDPLFEIVDFLMPAISAAFNFFLQPIKSVMEALGGIVKIFKGDFLEGIHDIGAAVLGFFMKPFTLVYDLIVGFFPSVGKLVDKAVNFMKDKIKGLLPDWALKLLGMGPDDKSKDAEKKPGEKMTQVNGESKSKEKVHDAHIGSDGGLIVSGGKGTYQLDENDSVIAGTNLEGTASGGSSAAAPASGNAEVVALLKELIKKVDQPVNINIGGRVVQEIDRMITMNKTYNTKGDNTYGAS